MKVEGRSMKPVRSESVWGNHCLVEVAHGFGFAGPGVVFVDAAQGGFAHARAQAGVVGELYDGIGKARGGFGGGGGRDAEGGFVGGNHGGAVMAEGDGGKAGSHGFEEDVAGSIAQAGEEEDVVLGQEGFHFGERDFAGPFEVAGAKSEAGGEAADLGGVRAVTHHGISAADIDRVRVLFERCERERFGVISPDAVHEAQNYGILKELNQVLRKCERIRL